MTSEQLTELKRCVPNNLKYLSNPPKNKCKNCGEWWACGSETPICTIQQTPDEKVLDYLERAKEIELKFTSVGIRQETFEGYQANIIEIAKLLQREEK